VLLNSGFRALALGAAILTLTGFLASSVRQRARTSATLRARLIVGSVIGAAVGAALAFWLPRQIPETPGSPASLVGVLVSWIVGGGLLFLTLAALIGAVLGKRET